MGTQFWWFYDVLVLALAAGLLYNAIAKGFNKLVFQLAGFVLAFVVGFFGSGYLAQPAYDVLYREQIRTTLTAAYDVSAFYETAAQGIQKNQPDGAPAQADAVFLQETAAAVLAGEEAPQWFITAIGSAADIMLGSQISPSPDRTISDLFAEDPEALSAFLEAAGDAAQAADSLERSYVRPDYTQMLKMALFLLLQVVVLIVVGVISGMAGNLEEQMHIRKFNRALAVPVGLIEAASMLLFFAVAVKLAVMATDNMMLLFNEETVAETKLFRLIYRIVSHII